jgi:molybdopterin-guanine dinucleotide biosynthesis protein A
MTLVTDLFDVRSSLTGIHAGLFYACQPFTFVTACDTPFLQPALIRLLLGSTGNKADVVIPQTEMGLEPLCAVYSQRCLQPITQRLQQGDLRVRSFFRQVRVVHVNEDRLRRVDPDLESFYNINTPADLAQAQQRYPALPVGKAPQSKGG